MAENPIDRGRPPRASRTGMVGLAVLLTLAVAGDVAEAQERRFYVAVQAGKGEGWTAAGAQLELALAARWRIAPDVLMGEGAGGANLSALWGLSRSEPQRVAVYLGGGLGAISADDVTELALHVRAGGELPITPKRLGVRLEAREYLIDGDGKFMVVGMIRVP